MLLVFLVYQPVWQASYLWDDDKLITANRCIVGPLGLKEIWTTRAADICPLTITTFWAEYKLWGAVPLPYHLVNVLLHIVCALLLWQVLRALQVPGAWLGAALWALHPVQVESVAWIAEMKNTEAGVFYLLSILLFLKWLKSRELDSRARRAWRYVGVLFCAALALSSKSSTVVLPVVLCLLAWWKESGWRWRLLLETGPIFLLSTIAGGVSIWTQALQGAPSAGSQVLRNWSERLAVTGNVPWFYLAKLAWPYPLMTVYPRWEVNPRHWSAFLPLVAVFVLLLVLWWQRRTWAAGWLLAFGYFLVALLPVSGLVKIVYFYLTFVADHFLYLASMGPLALIGVGLSWLTRRSVLGRTSLSMACIAGLLLTLGVVSWHRCWAYKNEETLWTDAVAKNPSCSAARENLGRSLERTGRIDEAIEQYQEALKINDSSVGAHNNLGNVLLQKGQSREAILEYQEAVTIDPKVAQSYNNLGNGFLRSGQIDQAIAQYQVALRLDPENVSAHNDLGDAFLQKGRVDEAVVQYQKALRLEPGQAAALGNLAVAHFQNGQVDDAIREFRDVLRINPNDAKFRYDLGNALFRTGQVDEAIGQYREALKLNPRDAGTYLNLGNALIQKGQMDEAIARYQEAVRINPRLFSAHSNLGNAFEQTGQVEEAIAQYREALKLNPNHARTHDKLGNVLVQKGQLDEAILQYQEALKINPASAEVHCDLGNVLFRCEQADAAADQYQAALKIKPDNAFTHHSLGLVLAHQGRLNEAIAQFREALRLKPDFSDAQQNLVTAQTLLQQAAEAH